MATAALVGAAGFNAAHFVRQRPDLVVAVDGGYAHLRSLGVEPQVVLGDFDSLGYVPAVPGVERHPAEKDESDMELAFRAAEARGCDRMLLYGALGGRLDHTIANLQLMVGCTRRGGRAFAIGADFAAVALHGPGEGGALRFGAVPPQAFDGGPYGNCISVFAAGGAARGVTERGLKYPLDGWTLDDGASLGLSNEFTGAPACISVAEGDVIVTFPLGAWDHLR